LPFALTLPEKSHRLVAAIGELTTLTISLSVGFLHGSGMTHWMNPITADTDLEWDMEARYRSQSLP
jgi:hypothetical protein